MALDSDEMLGTLRELRKALNLTASIENPTDMAFEFATAAALAKAYEFCELAIESRQDQSFFLLASLRGICEDYISLRFIREKEGSAKNAIVTLKALEDVYASSITQWNFFTQNQPSQILYFNDTFQDERDRKRIEIQNLLKNHNAKRNTSLPSVFYMAKTIGLETLYEYVYHATSQFVHFNPRLLLRLGWHDSSVFEFSTKNFAAYYKDFSMFYGIYLLIAIIEWLSSLDSATIIDKNMEALATLKKSLQDVTRWPELVTFEEMNIGALSKNLFFQSPDGANKRSNAAQTKP